MGSKDIKLQEEMNAAPNAAADKSIRRIAMKLWQIEKSLNHVNEIAKRTTEDIILN